MERVGERGSGTRLRVHQRYSVCPLIQNTMNATHIHPLWINGCCRSDAVQVYTRDIVREAAHERPEQDPGVLLHRKITVNDFLSEKET